MAIKLTEFLFERIGVPDFSKFLDLSALRHKLISGNVANASTPGYSRQDIDFFSEFERASGTSSHLAGEATHSDHIPLGNHESRTPDINSEPVEAGEVNSVDIDKEVTTLAQNELLFSVGAKLLQNKLAALRNAITSE